MEPRHCIPDAPAGFSPESFFHGIHWHQHWELFRRVFTPGKHDVALHCDKMQAPCNLQGMRVLDAGA